MATRVHGIAKAQNTLEGELDTFRVFVSAPYAVDRERTVGVNIRTTGNIKDISQRNFEVLVQTIGLRAAPVNMDEPVPTANLSAIGAPSLKGQGFVWTFAIESADAFSVHVGDINNPTGLLVDELHGIVLPSGEILDSKTYKKNIEFVKIKSAR